MRSSPDVIFRALDDGGVLVHMDGNHIYELNETAAHVWQRIAAGDPVEAIVDSLVAAFDVDLATAARETHRVVDTLVREGLVAP
jgi:Coenzyme PQQ synthesis protein D (PqqD)